MSKTRLHCLIGVGISVAVSVVASGFYDIGGTGRPSTIPYDWSRLSFVTKALLAGEVFTLLYLLFKNAVRIRFGLAVALTEGFLIAMSVGEYVAGRK